LAPELFALIRPLRMLLARRKGRLAVDVELALTEQGVDLGLKGLPLEGLEQTGAILAFAQENRLARLTIDQGCGAEAVWRPEPATVSLAGGSLPFPPGAFQHATADGEAALLSAAREWLGEATTMADLFAGLG